MTGHLEPIADPADGDDRISAYLDGELDGDELSEFEAHLGADAELVAEVRAIASTRAALQALPQVLPRRDLAELGPRPLAGTRKGWPLRAVAAAGAVAAVAVLLALVVFNNGDSAIVPALNDLVGQHESASALETTEDFQVMEREAVDMAMKAPDEMAGMPMGGVYQSRDVVQVVYTDGVHNVSIFHQPGEVAWDEMPEEGEMMMMDGDQAWHGSMHGSDVVVVDSDDGVVTIVADGDMATDVAEALTA